MLQRGSILVAVMIALFCARFSSAEDVYYTIPLEAVTLTEGAWPEVGQPDWQKMQKLAAMPARAMLENGEALVVWTQVPIEFELER